MTKPLDLISNWQKMQWTKSPLNRDYGDPQQHPNCGKFSRTNDTVFKTRGEMSALILE